MEQNTVERAIKTETGSGGGGVFLAGGDLGRLFDQSFLACAFLFCFLKWKLARAHLFHSLGKDQSTVAQRAETTVAELFDHSFPAFAFVVLF